MQGLLLIMNKWSKICVQGLLQLYWRLTKSKVDFFLYLITHSFINSVSKIFKLGLDILKFVGCFFYYRLRIFVDFDPNFLNKLFKLPEAVLRLSFNNFKLPLQNIFDLLLTKCGINGAWF